jgi:hypothetical protein
MVLLCCCTVQAYYCLTLKLTIIQGTGRMGGYIPVPPFDLHSMTQVRLLDCRVYQFVRVYLLRMLVCSQPSLVEIFQ